jgi:hypothetical protein
MRQLSLLGYRCAPIKASGRRGKRRRDLNTIDGDLIAWYEGEAVGWPHAVLEIGGAGKRVRKALDALHAHGLPPGHIALVGRVMHRSWHWYRRDYTVAFGRLGDALTAP